MKFFLSFSILIFSLFAQDSFITKFEYSKMLYKNPRGVGCDRCHGLKGEGKIIAKYKDRGKVFLLKAPKIKDINFKKFYKKLNSSKLKSPMPKYFLTKDEIKALYFYLKKINRKDKR